MLRSTCAFACLLFLGTSAVSKQVDSDGAAHDVTGYMATMAANEHAKVCFANVKLMMLGYESKEKGLSVEDFVSMGLFSAGSDEYRSFAAGREMSGYMDKPVDDYFLRCLDQSLKKSMQK